MFRTPSVRIYTSQLKPFTGPVIAPLDRFCEDIPNTRLCGMTGKMIDNELSYVNVAAAEF